jgi:hypothetical protein
MTLGATKQTVEMSGELIRSLDGNTRNLDGSKMQLVIDTTEIKEASYCMVALKLTSSIL